MFPSQSVVDIEQWLGTDASDLPALPRVAAELASMAEDSDAACEQLAELVVREPVLAARMLRLVNSAYFGLSQKITDIRHAVYLLGLRTVRTVALTAAVISAFKDTKAGSFDLDRFWRHSISAAAVCATLAKRCGTFSSETAFSLGLLHDIGKMVLVRYRLDDAERIVQKAEHEAISFYDCEQQIAPVTHAELGAWLGQRWSLPTILVEGTADHHKTPAPEEELPPMDAALKFANYLCAVKGITATGSCAGADLPPQAWYALGLNSGDVPALIDVINAEIRTAEDLIRTT